jgi:hypothetical protein
MNIAAIPKMRLPAPNGKDDQAKIANDARRLLGYSVMAHALTIPSSLSYALRELEIEPLNERAVKAYKESREHTGMWSGTRNAWTRVIIAICFFVASGFCLDMKLSKLGGTYSHGWGTSSTAMLILGTAFLLYAFGSGVIGENIGHGTRTQHRWETTNIASYTGNIPEFALIKAIQIKEKLPRATFQIEQLVAEREEKVPEPDPFLVVVLEDERFYVDVWEEAQYERTM